MRPCPTQAAVPVRILALRQVLLVVPLRRVEHPPLRREDLGGDLPVAGVRQHLLVRLAGRLRRGRLGRGVGVDRGAVLGADVVALAEALGRVVGLPEELEQTFVRDLPGVEDHADRLRVAGQARADLLVHRVLGVAALIADQRGPHARRELPELSFGAPEAAQTEVGGLQALGVGAEERVAEDGVAVGDLVREFGPALECLFGGGQLRRTAEEHEGLRKAAGQLSTGRRRHRRRHPRCCQHSVATNRLERRVHSSARGLSSPRPPQTVPPSPTSPPAPPGSVSGSTAPSSPCRDSATAARPHTRPPV